MAAFGELVEVDEILVGVFGPTPRSLVDLRQGRQLRQLAFTRCGELNLYVMVDAQIAVVESELLASP